MSAKTSSLPGCEFWLIRHAETEWNRSGRWQGHADPPLSAAGSAQARRLADTLAQDPLAPDLGPLFCSDLRRCLETASAIGKKLGLSPQADPRLRELDIGEWSGKSRAEIEACHGEILERFEAEDPDARPPGGETRREIRARVQAVMKEIAELCPDSRILVVTHLGMLRALLPGCEPANAELIRIAAGDALNRRQQSLAEQQGEGVRGEGAL